MKPQRFLAASGFGSRRACEQIILEGRVTINGQPLTFNMDIQDEDDVRVDGKPAGTNNELVYIALHKPAGTISDHSLPHVQSALDLVDVPQRLFAIGRLDKGTTGLLLLTNDGELAFHLTHPRFEHEKEYRVWVAGSPSQTTLHRWRAGILLEGELTAPAQISIVNEPVDRVPGTTCLRIVLHEGRKRQIKRVAKLLGHPVQQLVRMRIGCVQLGDLRPGEWRRLTTQEIEGLTASVNA